MLGAAKPRPTALRLRGFAPIRYPALMGVLNVTPDSFSDPGRYFDRARAVDRALQMADQGASIIDIGGESTRPGAREVPAGEELSRVMPVISDLRGRLKVPISIDTRKAAVAQAGLAEGAAIVNDVSALEFDPAMSGVVERARAALIIMHMRGVPADMMRHVRYRDVVAEVRAYLARRARVAIRSGIPPSRIIIDPGLGFAKLPQHSLKLLAALPRLCALGYPILVGTSRKSFVRRLAGAGERDVLFGTAASVALAVAGGASILRVHDPAEMAVVVKMAAAITNAAPR